MMRGLVALCLFIGFLPNLYAQTDPAPPITEVNSNGSGNAYAYSPSNKRDPFRPPLKFKEEERGDLPEIQRYTLDQLKLSTILWNAPDTQMTSRAMFRDPKQRIYILKEGDRIGKNFGVIFKINRREVIVAEKYTDPFGNESIQETTLVISEEKPR